jgi:hypothetical protein
VNESVDKFDEIEVEKEYNDEPCDAEEGGEGGEELFPSFSWLSVWGRQ